MKFPRNESAEGLIRKLSKLGYQVNRQTGSHIRLERVTPEGRNHITIPNHTPIKIGTLASILRLVADQLGVTKEDLMKEIYGS